MISHWCRPKCIVQYFHIQISRKIQLHEVSNLATGQRIEHLIGLLQIWIQFFKKNVLLYWKQGCPDILFIQLGKIYFFMCLMGKNYGLPLKISIVLIKNTLVRFIITCNWEQFFLCFFCATRCDTSHQSMMSVWMKFKNCWHRSFLGSQVTSHLCFNLTFSLKCPWNEK